VTPSDERIDFDQVRDLALEHRPKLIVAGATAYPRIIESEPFRAIADEVGALFMFDAAHIAGLIAGGVHPSPVPYADVVTLTTHKTLRGPRGGCILSKAEHAEKIDKALFPGMQGGPLDHVIAAKAVAFREAAQPWFADYSQLIVDNAQTLAEALSGHGLRLVSGGTDTHLMLVDLRKKRLTGKAAEAALGRAFITCNKNGIPFDPEKPMVTSGVRLGTPAGTTRGFKAREFVKVGELITEVLDGLAKHGEEGNGKIEGAVRRKVQALTDRFPIY
jgi:glycine hydroxymethyltransferase